MTIVSIHQGDKQKLTFTVSKFNMNRSRHWRVISKCNPF
ncbi:hypothetical protein D3OALGB2SA_2876 [Olavius algarvensis associated proteobacterium Delta 3]|nr:hypothetical protein D3OALGB2SA_2876 [Olavius algarvensis associated proteobacterium Delta 3]